MNDASNKIKSTDFTSKHKFTLGIPISVTCKKSNLNGNDDNNVIAYIYYNNISYWIYCMNFYMNGDADYDNNYEYPCIVYYI